MLNRSSSSLRAAIYARFSSILQNPRSIEDQVRLCRAKVRDLGAVVVDVHSDPASTGTTIHSRPGLTRLLEDVKHGLIDLVCAESLDRISRDQADIAGIYKRLQFRNVRLVTLQEGEIESIHISVGGFVNQIYIDNLASKTRRGQIGAVYSGRIPGGVSYGYRMANRIDEHGRPLRGLREIHPEQADVVRRIYRLYADGNSVRTIAHILNREGIPGPRAGRWSVTSINGNRTRRTGILNNEIYCGRLLYGRQKFVRDPDTGRRQARPVPPSKWTVQEVPDLRIVDDELWYRVQKRRQAGEDRRKNLAPNTPLPLTGRVRCAQCGGNMNIFNKRRYSCQIHRDTGTCDNPRGISAVRLENQVCALLAFHISTECDLPELLHRAAEESALRRERLKAGLADRKERIARLLELVERGTQSRAAQQRILEIERETAAIELELDSLPALPSRTPKDLAVRLRDRLAALNGAIAGAHPGTRQRTDALLLARSLIERIDIAPLPRRGQVEITIRPRADALVAFALQENCNLAAPATR